MPVETLYDEFLYRKTKFAWDVPSSRMALANRFVLDSEASEFVGRMIREVGFEILSNHEFARAPYDVTWIELDHRAYYRALTGREPDETGDERTGFIVDNGWVRNVSSSKERGSGTFPISWWLGRPMSFEEELELAQRADTSQLMLRRWIVGDSGVHEHSGADDLIADVCRNNMTEIDVPELKGATLNQVMASGAGTLKLAICLLLLLTRPGKSVITLESSPRHSGIVRGKRVVFHSYGKVRLRLDQTRAIRRVRAALETGIRRRRHEVRGHWVQSHRSGISCSHDWDGSDPNHFHCVMCGATRWWRKHHSRGDSTKGWVTKDYEVTR